MLFSRIKKFFAAAPHAERLPDDEVQRLYPRYRWRIMEATFLGYAMFYLVRNNLSVVAKDIEGALHHGARVEELVANPPLEAVERRWPGYGIEIRYGKAPEVGGYVDELLVEVRISWQSRGMAKAERFRQIIVRSRSTRLPRLSP